MADNNEYSGLLKKAGEESAKDETLASLESALDKEKDGRREERFYFCCAIVLLINMIGLRDMQTWSSPIIIGVGELALLVCLSQKFGVDRLAEVANKIMAAIIRRLGDHSKE